MDKFELYDSCIDAINLALNDIKNKTMTLKRPEDVFYYRFFTGQIVKEEIMELVSNTNVAMVHHALDCIKLNTRGSITTGVIGSYSENIKEADFVFAMQYLKGLMQQAINLKRKVEIEVDKDYFINDLIEVCRLMQGNSIYLGDVKENIRNDYVRDLLEFKGYIAKDQTRQSISKNKKDAGELDLLIRANTKVQHQIVIEGLNLDSCDTNYIKEHFDKLFTYDTNGNDFNVILGYVTAKKFEEHCLKYKRYIEEEYDGEHKPIESEVIKIEGTGKMFMLRSAHSIGTKTSMVYHLLVQYIEDGLKH